MYREVDQRKSDDRQHNVQQYGSASLSRNKGHANASDLFHADIPPPRNTEYSVAGLTGASSPVGYLGQ
jgi:hypothetical protein